MERLILDYAFVIVLPILAVLALLFGPFVFARTSRASPIDQPGYTDRDFNKARETERRAFLGAGRNDPPVA
jgi:hypothetical protein